MSNDLPPKCAALYEALEGQGDVHVVNLYEAVLGKKTNDHRLAQQLLASYIIRLNRRLRVQRKRVEPGSLKLTYRLSPII